jgi:prevent-host-death family protein
MAETITAREANHSFCRILAGVREGKEYVVTLHGRPMARIVPERPTSMRRSLTPEQERALAEIWEIAKNAQPGIPWKFNRDELYDPDV